MSIDYSDITVIVQGPVDWTISKTYSRATTLMLTRHLRRLMPSARIVLSTWNGQRIDGLDCDTVVFSQDPGPQGVWPSFTPNNVNRQIVSTVAGLNEVATPFCLKIRSDIILMSSRFVHVYAGLGPIAPDERAIFKYPIVSNNLSSRNSATVLRRLPDNPLPLHPSDHVHFGRTDDLRRLWNIPLQSDQDAFYFMDRVQPNRWRASELSRLAPEQHIIRSAIGGKSRLKLAHYADAREEVMQMSDYYMGTHFHFVRDDVFAILFEKYHTDHHRSFEWMRHDGGAREATTETFMDRQIRRARALVHLP